MPNQSDPNQTNQSSNQPVSPPIPPIASIQADLPPLPPDFSTMGGSSSAGQNAPPEIPTTSPANPPPGSTAPSDLPSVVSTKPKKKFGTGRIIAAILGIFVLAGGIGAGVIQIQQPSFFQGLADKTNWRDIGNPNAGRHAGRLAEEAANQAASTQTLQQQESAPKPWVAGGYTKSQVWVPNAAINTTGYYCGGPCPQEPDSDIAGYYTVGENAGAYYPIGQQPQTTTVENDKSGTTTVTPTAPPTTTTPTAPPTTITPTASCQGVTAYDASWAAMTKAQLSGVAPGTTINFCVNGTKSEGTFDKAQFKINTTLEPETTTQRPGSTDFCQSYTTTPTDTTVNVQAKIHHSTLGWQGEAI